MRLSIAVTTTSLLALMAAGPATEPVDPDAAPELVATIPADAVPHDAGDTGVSVQSPTDWTEVKGHTPNVKLILDAKRGPRANLVVEAADGLTLPKVLTEVPPGLAATYKNFKLHKADLVKLNGQPAARLIFSATVSDQDLKLCQLFVIKGGKQYVLTYTAKPDEFDASVKDFEGIAISMRFP